MRHLFVLVIIISSLSLSAQRWGIRPELCLTAAKAEFVSNTNYFMPFKSTFSYNPDFNIHFDYFINKNLDRLTFSLGTYTTSFVMTGNKITGDGYLGFLNPDLFLSQGTSGSFILSGSYGRSIEKPSANNRVFLSGGLQYYLNTPIGDGEDDGFFGGDFIIHSSNMQRQSKGNPGWHAGLMILFRNKKKHEVLQFSFKYLGTFNSSQFTNDYYYSIILNSDPPEILGDQVLRYRLTGAGIQLGISKTLIYFPRQRKMNKG